MHLKQTARTVVLQTCVVRVGLYHLNMGCLVVLTQ